MLEQRIQQHFFDGADLQYQMAESLARPVAAAAQAVVGCLTAGGKLLVCGQAGSAAQASYLAATLVGRFERQRPPLAALALGADASLLATQGQGGNADHLAQQVQALGQPGDVLIVLDAGLPGFSLRKAVDEAHGKDMSIVALTGRDAASFAAVLGETDVLIQIPHERAARVREQHLVVLHALCDAVDLQLLGELDPA